MKKYTLVFENRAPITFEAKDDDEAGRAAAILSPPFRMYEDEAKRLVWFCGLWEGEAK